MYYVLRQTLPPRIVERYRLSSSSNRTPGLFGLTAVVLGLIRLNGGKMDEDVLWTSLEELGVCRDDTAHPYFGKSADAIKLMEARRYVLFFECSKIIHAHGHGQSQIFHGHARRYIMRTKRFDVDTGTDKYFYEAAECAMKHEEIDAFLDHVFEMNEKKIDDENESEDM